ncbi:MAG: hypothetical protein HKN47_24170 [Pirellulaceae bacterium]|nr:hypothetical protein [Pirellulaceae bacterium]
MTDRLFDEISYDVPPETCWTEEEREDGFQKAPLLRRIDAVRDDTISSWSALTGLLGLAGFLFVIASAVPVEMHLLEETSIFRTRPVFWIISTVLMAIFFPAATVGAIVIAVPMFWHISVLKRYLVAVAMFVPAVVGLSIGLIVLLDAPADEMVPGTVTLFSAAFVAAASVAVAFQMCSPWTLTHLRRSDEPLPRLGIRTLFELTMIVAITIAFIRLVESDMTSGPILLFAGIAGFASLMGILACIAFLRDGEVTVLALIGAGVAAFGMSFVFVSTIATLEYGWSSVWDQFYVTLPVTLVGAAIVFGTAYLCIYWLRQCGWRCVR